MGQVAIYVTYHFGTGAFRPLYTLEYCTFIFVLFIGVLFKIPCKIFIYSFVRKVSLGGHYIYDT